MIIINAKSIASFNPCKLRLDNYMQHYAEFSGGMKEFLALENIAVSDKLWLACRLLTKPQRVRWAALCNQSVLHIFEARYPEDKRPRQAIELMLSGNYTKEQRIAAGNGARQAVAAVAAADAVDAAAAAAYAAAAAVAAYAYAYADAAAAADAYAYAYADAAAAAYAAAAVYADAAAADADADAYAAARKIQQEKNFGFLLQILEESENEK